MNVHRSCYSVAVNANRACNSWWVYGGRDVTPLTWITRKPMVPGWYWTRWKS